MADRDRSIRFRRFRHLTLDVDDIAAATRDWAAAGFRRIGADRVRVRFAVGDAAIVLQQSVDEGARVAEVCVEVDDPASAAARLGALDVPTEMTANGAVRVDPRCVTGVPLVLEPAGGTAVPAPPDGTPFRRIGHVVVAVQHDPSAITHWARLFGPWPACAPAGREAGHHVPVGKAWFGLTAAGTDATAVGRFVQRRGEGVYALGVIVDDLASTVATLQRRGVRLVRDVASSQIFIHPAVTHGLLIDLVDHRHPPPAERSPDRAGD